MRLGILADIHGEIAHLQELLKRLTRAGVDQFVVLGDIIYDSRNALETIELLSELDVVGVWGNHELGVATQPDEAVGELFAAEVLEFFARLSSLHEIEDVLLSHSLPTIDALDPVAYYMGPRATDPDAVQECFSLFPQRIFLTGHLHGWWAATPTGVLPWDGLHPLRLQPAERYLIVIHAVLEGYAALLDTEQNLLTPIHVGEQ